MDRRGTVPEIEPAAKVLDVGVAKWFDEISIRGEISLSLSLSLFLSLPFSDVSCRRDVAEYRRTETIRETASEISASGQFIFREYRSKNISESKCSFWTMFQGKIARWILWSSAWKFDKVSWKKSIETIEGFSLEAFRAYYRV